jgi:hypothetical protein
MTKTKRGERKRERKRERERERERDCSQSKGERRRREVGTEISSIKADQKPEGERVINDSGMKWLESNYSTDRRT